MSTFRYVGMVDYYWYLVEDSPCFTMFARSPTPSSTVRVSCRRSIVTQEKVETGLYLTRYYFILRFTN